MHVRIEYTDELLGTASANPEIHSEFIASMAPDAPSRKEEVAALGAEAVETKALTVFPRGDDGSPFLWDYQIKGFFKDACGSLRRVSQSRSAKLKAYKKAIDGTLFVQPRKVPLTLPEGAGVGRCERPLRASTAQGERIALAASETVPAGTVQEFDVVLLDPSLEGVVTEWLDYGKMRGIGQWRNSGKGTFGYEVKSVDCVPFEKFMEGAA